MINVEGRVKEERRHKGGVTDSRAKRTHLNFGNAGIVGHDDPESTSEIHGKKKLEPKPAEEENLRGKKVLTDEEIRAKLCKHRAFGKCHIKPFKAEHDGEEKPVGPPPGANLTARQRAEKIISTALSNDPSLQTAIAATTQRHGDDTGIFEAVKVVQRAEAAKHVEKRDTKAATLRSADEPSKLVAPFYQNTTQQVSNVTLRYSKRMITNPAAKDFGEERSPEQHHGIRRVSTANASSHGIPYDTVNASVDGKDNKLYPDPPLVGKGKEIQDPQGKRRVGIKVSEHDLDEIAQRKATARCGPYAATEIPQFVLGDIGPGKTSCKNASPQKNRSQIYLGGDNYTSESRPSTAHSSVSSSSSSAVVASNLNRRCAFSFTKNASTKLW